MAAAVVCVARPAGRTASAAPQPSLRHLAVARALSIPSPQPALGASSYTAGPGAQLEAAAPSCPWPQPQQPAAAQQRGIFAWLQVSCVGEQEQAAWRTAAGGELSLCGQPRAAPTQRCVIATAPPLCACPCPGSFTRSLHAHRLVSHTILQGAPQQPAAAEGALPPEVERLMRFTDAPQDAEQQQEQGWLRFWRYQGP